MPASIGYQNKLIQEIRAIGGDDHEPGWKYLYMGDEARMAEKQGISAKQYIDFTSWRVGEGEHDDAQMREIQSKLYDARRGGYLGDFVEEGNPVDRKFLDQAKEKYAWPGGYEMYFVTDDGGVLSADTVVEEWEQIKDAHPGDGWYVVAVGSTADTDEELIDDHTGKVIGGNPVARTHRTNNMLISGNPEEVTLHEAMEAIADWMDYESEVVEEAAEDLDALGEDELASAAHQQADAMEEAAEEIHEAADEAREAAAVAFNEEGTPAVEIAAEDSPEGEVVGGNTSAGQPTVGGQGSAGRTMMRGNPIPFDGTGEEREAYWLGFHRALAWKESGMEPPDDPLSGEWAGESMNEIFGHPPTEEELDAFDEGWNDATLDVVRGNPVSRHRRFAKYGNPDPPPMPAGSSTPAGVPDPKGAAPLPATGKQVGTSPNDVPPEASHWYTKPLFRSSR